MTTNHFERVFSDLGDFKRLVVRLLARENLSMHIVPGLETAHFNLVDRILSIPYWKDVSNVVFDMLVGHEVSHAIFTDSKLYISDAAQKPSGMGSFVNIIEDARVDRKIKGRYPGLVSIYEDAYAELFANGPIFRGDEHGLFMPTGYEPFNEMRLIDRINLYYKLVTNGIAVDIPFSDEERVWLSRIDMATTLQEVIDIARELYTLAKEQHDDNGTITVTTIQVEGAGEDTDQDASSRPEKSPKKSSPETGDTTPISTTDGVMSEQLKALTTHLKKETDVVHAVMIPLDDAFVKSRTLSAREHVRLCEAAIARDSKSKIEVYQHLEAMHKTWLNQYGETARLMAVEFHRRKSAREMQRAARHKTGQLDMRRLHLYRFVEDIFKHIQKLPDGQSHGIHLLADGSGSMTAVMPAVIDQILLFAMFAFYAQIPFEAWLFSSWSSRADVSSAPILGALQPSAGGLINLISTSQSRADFTRQCLMLHGFKTKCRSGGSQKVSLAFRTLGHLGLGSTPLYTGMLLMEHHMAEMKTRLNLDKIIPIVVSDGGDTDGLNYWRLKVSNANVVTPSLQELSESTPFLLRDSLTKKNYTFAKVDPYGHYRSTGSSSILDALFRVFRDRYKSESVYVYLSSDTDGASAITDQDGFTRRAMPQDVIAKALRTDGVYVYPSDAGVASVVSVVSHEALQLRENLHQVMEKATEQTAADMFTHAILSRQARRRFVNAVMPFIS